MSAYTLIAFDITSSADYETYRERAAPLIEKFDINPLVNAAPHRVVEGLAPARNIGILEFADMPTLKKWYFSEDYQECKSLFSAGVDYPFLVFLDGIPDHRSSSSSCAYFVAAFDVVDREGYEEYQRRTVHLIDQFDINVLAMTENFEVIEGAAPADRMGILEFKDLATAQAWHESEAYLETSVLRATSLDNKFSGFLEGVKFR